MPPVSADMAGGGSRPRSPQPIPAAASRGRSVPFGNASQEGRPAATSSTGENPHAHRNRRLAFDFAVLAAAAASALDVASRLPSERSTCLATAFATMSDAPIDAGSASSPADASPHRHRRRTHRPATPPVVADARQSDTRPRDPVAWATHITMPTHTKRSAAGQTSAITGYGAPHRSSGRPAD